MKYIQSLILFFLLSTLGCKTTKEISINYHYVPSINADMTTNMVIEIPTGTTAKYEMDKSSYTLIIDSINNEPRFIDYLGYPGNYGMIPNTILPKDKGGDGDPLDILLLGPTETRGSVVKVSIIGLLQLLDNGEQDDKLIAINPNSRWSKVKDLEDLDKYYPGTKTIISTFFQNYKGAGQIKLTGWADKLTALQLLNESIHKTSVK